MQWSFVKTWAKCSIKFNTVAALVGADLFARIRAMQDRFDELSARVAQDFAGVPADEGMAEIDAAVASERRR